jgi:hypothetical protein
MKNLQPELISVVPIIIAAYRRITKNPKFTVVINATGVA